MTLDPIERLSAGIRPLPGVQKQPETARPQPPEKAGASFKQALEKAIQADTAIRLSRHVQERIQQRHLTLNEQQMQQLQNAVQLAREKGIKDSLVLMKDAAFIVNVPSRTVITALQRHNLQQQVFTQIDGAIISE